MKIKELSLTDFYQFTLNNPLASHYQTMNYALLMSEEGYDHEFIGFVDESNHIYAASLILTKKIKFRTKYAYAPKGFILDYFNQDLLNQFTKALIQYYKKRHVCFIKLNPEIAISEINLHTKEKTYNWNQDVISYMEEAGYLKLKNNLYFESLLPRFNGILSLKDFQFQQLSKNTRNKIRRGISKGLNIELSERSGMDILQRFIQKKRDCNAFYYKDYYNAFHQDNMVDLFLVSIDADTYLMNARKAYEIELEKNNNFNQTLIEASNAKNINKKMMSDRRLLAYKNDVYLATELCKRHEKVYIAGALVIRFRNRVQILISGYDKKYKSFDPNYYLHYALIEYYKKNFDYLDMNGMTGDFEKKNPYYGLNQFKLGFNPKVYEFIGEFDLPIRTSTYKKLRNSGQLAKIFNKTNLKQVPK